MLVTPPPPSDDQLRALGVPLSSREILAMKYWLTIWRISSRRLHGMRVYMYQQKMAGSGNRSNTGGI